MSTEASPPPSKGYGRLAHLMGPRRLGIFRKFTELNAFNILQLQAELEQHFTPRTLSTFGIRTRKYDISLLQNWLLRPEGGNSFLEGYEAGPWAKGNENDLISVCDIPDFDVFSNWLASSVIPWLHRIVLHRWRTPLEGHEDVGLVDYQDAYLVALGKIVSVFVSIVFPSVAILVLYFIKRMVVRVGMVILFSALFSGSLAVFTNAKPIEIFAATAVFASVQVVFVGSTSIGTGN